MMQMQKGKIDGKMVDIITQEEYYNNPSLYSYNYTAINGGNGFVYQSEARWIADQVCI